MPCACGDRFVSEAVLAFVAQDASDDAMSLFSRKSSVGLTWTREGACFGVRLRRGAGAVRLEDVWTVVPGEDGRLPQVLAEGADRLNAAEAGAVVVGPASPEAAFVDLNMPPLPPDDLRRAVEFELPRHVPVAPEAVLWGYRVLPSSNGNQRSVRLITMRESNWAAWVEVASRISTGTDAIIPPAAVVDPILEDRPVPVPSPAKDAVFVLVPRQHGNGREIVLVSRDSETAVSALEGVLGMDGLDVGALADMPSDQRLHFVSAVLLALYGLSRSLDADRRTCPAPPYELRPRRNRSSRVLAAVLAIYVAGAVGVLGARWYRHGMSRFTRLRTESERLQQLLKADNVQPIPDELLEAIEKDLHDVDINRPTLTEALLELTRIVPQDAWVTSLTWTDGKLDVQVRTAQENSGIFEKLKRSNIFTDVVPLGTISDPRTGEYTLRFQMRAAFRTPSLSEAAPPGGQEEGTHGGEAVSRVQSPPAESSKTPPGEALEKKSPSRTVAPTRTLPPPPPPPPPPSGSAAGGTDGPEQKSNKP